MPIYHDFELLAASRLADEAGLVEFALLCFQLAAAWPPFFICRNENNFLCRGCFHPFLNWVSSEESGSGHPMRDINYSDPRNISVYVDYFQDLYP